MHLCIHSNMNTFVNISGVSYIQTCLDPQRHRHVPSRECWMEVREYVSNYACMLSSMNTFVVPDFKIKQCGN